MQSRHRPDRRVHQGKQDKHRSGKFCRWKKIDRDRLTKLSRELVWFHALCILTDLFYVNCLCSQQTLGSCVRSLNAMTLLWEIKPLWITYPHAFSESIVSHYKKISLGN